MMRFTNGDRVYVTSGHHKGRHGSVIATTFTGVAFQVAFDFGDEHWFPFWMLGEPLPICVQDNAATMRNARAALDIIESHCNKGGRNPPNMSSLRPPNPRGSRECGTLRDGFFTVSHDTTEIDYHE